MYEGVVAPGALSAEMLCAVLRRSISSYLNFYFAPWESYLYFGTPLRGVIASCSTFRNLGEVVLKMRRSVAIIYM